MALHNPQYIFGDFSPDEFNQFFVTPRSSVELPPYSGTLCSIQAEDELPDAGQEHQRIEFGVDEVIEPKLLSPGIKNKNFKCQRTYRLFAVVYHHGNSATGGHYTTDVFQIGLNGWLRIDDQTVKVINQYQVVKPPADRTAYLLYYRRVDLL